MITDVHGRCGNTVGLCRINCSACPPTPARLCGKPHRFEFVGKESRLPSSELDFVAKPPQPISSVLLLIPRVGRLSFHSLAPILAGGSVRSS